MSETDLPDRHSASSNPSPSSTERVARWRERRRRGVLYVAGLEVLARDLCVLQRVGCLASADPEVVSKDDVENALWRLLDGLAWRLGVLGAVSETPR